MGISSWGGDLTGDLDCEADRIVSTAVSDGPTGSNDGPTRSVYRDPARSIRELTSVVPSRAAGAGESRVRCLFALSAGGVSARAASTSGKGFNDEVECVIQGFKYNTDMLWRGLRSRQYNDFYLARF